ncbi:hypothetical protein [Jatrophihabitans sp.]|nr:hypothetical protein [Jatrophihabitans sp.]
MNKQQPETASAEVHDRYLTKINALIATDNEHLVADLADEYAQLLDQKAA